MPEIPSSRSLNDIHLFSPQTDSEDPYIYTPYLCKTVLELLGVASQFSDEDISEILPITFPAKYALYDRSESDVVQWMTQGLCRGEEVGPVVSELSLRGGMTDEDCQAVKKAINQGMLLTIFR
jgi:hypothetical protein